MSMIRIVGRQLRLSESRDAYAKLRREYLNKASDQKRRFLQEFSSRFPNADILISAFPRYLKDVVQQITDAALSTIARYAIYDIDEGVFGERLASRLALGDSTFGRLHDEYQTIVLSAAELQSYREAKSENRSQIIGGGFGIEGAARGMAIAGVANIALGMVHGFANATANAASSAAEKLKKAQLYADPATKEGLADVVFDAVQQAHFVVAELVNERSASQIFESVPAADQTKAAALLSNVIKGRVPSDAQADVLFQALELDPFANDVWFDWLTRFGDRDHSLGKAAEQIGIDELAQRKGTLLSEQVSSLPQSTPEECEAALAKAGEYGDFLGIDAQPEQWALQAKAHALDVQRRSFRGQVYDNQEQASAAERSWKRDELDRMAADMSNHKVEIKREGDQLVVVCPLGGEMPPRWVTEEVLHRQVAKMRTPHERGITALLVISGICFLPVAGTGVLAIALAVILWQRADARRRKELRAAHPALFGSNRRAISPN